MAAELVRVPDGSAKAAEAIQAFCRQLAELCDVLTAPFDVDSFEQAASSHALQDTNCSLLLHNALYQWLGERLELSVNVGHQPEQSTNQAIQDALRIIQDQGLIHEFVNTVANSCDKADAAVQPAERKKHSLLFDLQGPIDLLGPDEVDGLLAELASSDAPLGALDTLAGDIHLLEDLCFGPAWPQLCDGLGRLVGLGITNPDSASASVADPEFSTDTMQRHQSHPQQQQREQLQGKLLAVLRELVSSSAASSPPHAAELLAALSPYLAAVGVGLQLPQLGTGLGTAAPHGGSATVSTAPCLLAAAASLAPFSVGLTRVAHQLLGGLAAEFHTLPPGCATQAASAVCELVHAGLERAVTGSRSGATTRQLSSGSDLVPACHLELSSLDLLVLLDPELRWWRRLCAATHATRPLAAAAAEKHLAGVLEEALAAWVEAREATGPPTAGRAPTQLVACAALLNGLVSANNPALWSSGSGTPGGSCARMQRMVGHLTSCFCALVDRPRLLRPSGDAGVATDSSGVSGSRGSAFLHLAAGALATAASHGFLSLLAPSSSLAAGCGDAGDMDSKAPIVLLLQAIQRAAASTAAATGSGGEAPALAAAASETEAWLVSAVSVLRAAGEHASLIAASVASAPGSAAPVNPVTAVSEVMEGAPAAAEATCALLRHIAGWVRGCVGGAFGHGLASSSAPASSVAVSAHSVPTWTSQVVRCAVMLSVPSPAVAAELNNLYDTVHAVLVTRGRKFAAAATGPASASGAQAGAASGGAAGCEPRSGHGPSAVSLLDVLAGTVQQQQQQLTSTDSGGGCGNSRSCGAHSASGKQDATCPTKSSLPTLDGVEILAANAVLSYCTVDVDSGAAALPAALQREHLLHCAARWLCALYDSAGDVITGGGGGCSGSAAVRWASGTGCARIAAKCRVVQLASGLARICLAAQRALVAAGFARRVLNDVAAVLRSGEYESPYLEPLPYADALAALTAALGQILCWPGLLLLAPGEEPGGEQVSEHRAEVLALLQELVTWLDPSCSREGAEDAGPQGSTALPPQDAAVVSLSCFSGLVAADPGAAAALERDTNIRWYLRNLTCSLPDEEPDRAAADQLRGSQGRGGAGQAGQRGGGAAGRPEETNPQGEGERAGEVDVSQQSDMLLDLARGLLRVMSCGGETQAS